jgi:LuxR family maltose regulon positive regulatory protein
VKHANIPRPLGFQIPRVRALRLLDGLLDRRLSLVVAPAGYGKTVLLAQWAHSHDKDVVWLSLEATDAHPPRFFRLLATAFNAYDPRHFSDVSMLSAVLDDESVEAYLTRAFNKIANYGHDIVLVMDDYHAVDVPAFRDFLQGFIDRLPSNVHTVIASRLAPTLALSRLRVHDDLLELGVRELGFDPDETLALLEHVGYASVGPAAARDLCDSTNGWAVGLRLIAISGSDPKERGARGALHNAHSFISEYLSEEVFVDMGTDVRDFLVQTSFLETFNAPLCAHVLAIGEDEALGLLQRIKEAGLFITELGEKCGWFRYHQLFSEVLQAMLREGRPQGIEALYGRAFRWYRRNGLFDGALRLAARFEDYGSAIQLFEDNRLEMIFQTDTGPLSQWLTWLPSSLVHRVDVLSMAQGFVEGLMGNYRKALAYLGPVAERYRRRLEEAQGDDGPAVAALRDRLGELYVVYAFVCSINGFFDETAPYCARALELLSHDQRYLRAMVRQTQVTAGHLDDYHAVYREFLHLCETQGFARSRKMQVSALSNLASLQRHQGLFNEAVQTVEAALSVYPENPTIPMYGMAYVSRGMVRYERNDLEGAKGDLELGIQVSEYLKVSGLTAEAWACRGIIEQAAGDAAEAAACFGEAFALDPVFYRSVCRTVPQMRRLDRLRMLPPDALAALRSEAQGLLDADVRPLLALQRIATLHCAAVSYLYEGMAPRALELVAYLLEACFEGYPLQTTNALVLNAVILEQGGFRRSALKDLLKALHIAQGQGYVRAFVDWDVMIEDLLRRCLALDEGAGLPQGFRHRLQRALAPAQGGAAAAAAASAAAAAAAPLTERELEVLGLLDSGLTTRGVADLLSISYETVRTHLANCYAKLDVHGRVQAIKCARDRGLIA